MEPQERKLLARLLGFIQTGHFITWGEAEGFVQWFSEQDPKFIEDMQQIRSHWNEIIRAWDEIYETMTIEFGSEWQRFEHDNTISRWKELIEEKIGPFGNPISLE